MFPLNEIDQITRTPDDYRLLSRIPWTKPDTVFPIAVAQGGNNLRSLVVLDVETTGLNPDEDSIIELGLVHATIDIDLGVIVSINEAVSFYEDPSKPIPELITQLTGIDEAKVAGQRIDGQALVKGFADDPIVVAHSASFDRGMFEARFGHLDRLRWACSIKDIPWREFGYEGSKLEYLCLKNGGFYEGHRASIDCLATAWLLSQVDGALSALIASERAITYAVAARGAPFDVKDSLKARGYSWAPVRKVWHTVVSEVGLAEEQAFLSALYFNGGDRAEIIRMTSRERHKQKRG